MLEEFLNLVQSNVDLSSDQMQQAIIWMLAGQLSDEEIGKLLLALRQKGESVSELVGAVRALRVMMAPIRTKRRGLLDTCGRCERRKARQSKDYQRDRFRRCPE
jgi:anthranilate phosphoribosyltransferase